MRYLRRVPYLILSLLIGLLTMEVVLRVYLRFANTELEPAVPSTIGQFDARLGWSLRPLARAVSRRTGYPVVYRINSKGLRDDETTYNKPKSVLRIVVLGDSKTFGFGVPIEQHYTKLLESYFENVEVINMGVSGYGVDQLLLALRLEGFKYEPDLVMAFTGYFGGDRHMYTQRWGKQKPRFVLQDGKLVLKNSPVPKGNSGFMPERVRLFLKDHSVVYRVIDESIIPRLRKDENREAHNENEPLKEDALELGCAIIGEMNQESQRHGAKFVLVTKMKPLVEFCLKEGIACLNVSRSLSNLEMQLPRGLRHLNESGNGVLAWEIARFLDANGLLAGSLWNQETIRSTD